MANRNIVRETFIWPDRMTRDMAKDAYWATVPVHRLSWNAWIIASIIEVARHAAKEEITL